MRFHHNIIRTAQACDAWCREAEVYNRILPLAFLSGVLLFLIYFVTVAAPLNFPSASLFKVPQGAGIDEVAQQLKQKHLIHSALLFEAVERLEGARAEVIAGEYFFPGPQNLFTVASRLVQGDHELTPIKVTVPEGATAKEISQLLAEKVPDFDTDTFLKEAQPKEGTLFPDTYFFLPGEDADLVLTTFENNFNLHVQTQPVAGAITKFGKSLPQVLTMASLIEKEASNTKDRDIISGILWHRIALGMLLQVDAVFPYIIGVNSLQLTKADLQVDSPYNTYTNKGLPPGPISNPGLDAIEAAVEPAKTNYLYYLSDLHGVMHYCATYACQQANARKYLGS
ncbi:MAG: endolytic transglycosylase MltG [Patescibacteria group bacterium]|nr:endolytic transglycosylase MltG [Patescibacteria group bacterium]